MTVEISKNYAPIVLYCMCSRDRSLSGGLYTFKLFMLFATHFDVDSKNLCLVVSADSNLLCWGCVFHKDSNSSLCSAFSIMPGHLIASHDDALVIFQVGFLKAGHINVFFVEFLWEGGLLSPFCIQLQNVDVSGCWCSIAVSSCYPRSSSRGRERSGEVTSGS